MGVVMYPTQSIEAVFDRRGERVLGSEPVAHANGHASQLGEGAADPGSAVEAPDAEAAAVAHDHPRASIRWDRSRLVHAARDGGAEIRDGNPAVFLCPGERGRVRPVAFLRL